MLSNNANINTQDENGTTALMEAVTVRSLDTVRELINRGASLTIKNKQGKTALDIADKHRDNLIRSILNSSE